MAFKTVSDMSRAELEELVVSYLTKEYFSENVEKYSSNEVQFDSDTGEIRYKKLN